ncbi:hypothetical protein GCK72_012535 [Caenorhabditis remanei]|uniref:Methyltransferase FkbM domain-containing protein n=1 Tax=Caenorhabditis remanei TaxID=31234 RepID=A0A6A5GNN7_CAERE|nr:hypothetical protein GCK72_012535 [Caenorhabditis remanei]KAF1756082.1 hypothetical protein GCK72_012535 [Caenorhabditis remanei]
MYPTKMICSQTTLVVFMLVVILTINIFSYFTIFKIDRKFQATEQIDINNPKALDDLRAKYALNSEKYSQDLYRASRGDDHNEFYEKVKLEAFCPLKERLGEIDDGGKYVCNPRMVRKDDCTIISLGLNNQIYFDQHIQNVTGGHCRILGADKDPQNMETQAKYGGMNGKLFSGMIPTDISISSIMQTAGRKEVEILKMDIEGGEMDALEPFLEEYKVCQILIEVHKSPAEHFKMLQIMAKHNFQIYNVETTPYCVMCCEYSLIHESCMEQFAVVPLAPIVLRNEL